MCDDVWQYCLNGTGEIPKECKLNHEIKRFVDCGYFHSANQAVDAILDEASERYLNISKMLFLKCPYLFIKR